jgi:hypothetical protein
MVRRSRKLTLDIDRPLLVLILISVAVRLIMMRVYQPAEFNDTIGYMDAGRALQALEFERYAAVRTPLYPLLMIVTRFDPWSIWRVQALMGLGIVVMLYWLARYHVDDRRVAFAVGLGYTLAINLLFFEAALLTETISTFLLLLSLLFFILSRRRKGRLSFYVATAVTTSLAVLTRPLMLLLAPLYLLFFIRRWRQRGYAKLDRRRFLAGYVAPVVILLGGVVLFNGLKAGSYTLSTLTGYNLAGHGGAFMERAPDEDATLRDIYLKYRQARIDETGSHIWTIWDAQGEMLQATGLDFAGLNDALLRLSLKLIAAHPLLYLRNVAIAWAAFWASAVQWNLYTLAIPGGQTIFNGLWTLVRGLLVLINFTFLVIALYSLGERRRKYRLLNYDAEFHWLVLALILGTSVLQALLIYADNWRFSVPYQALIIYVVVIWLWLFNLRREQRHAVVGADEEEGPVRLPDLDRQAFDIDAFLDGEALDEEE